MLRKIADRAHPVADDKFVTKRNTIMHRQDVTLCKLFINTPNREKSTRFRCGVLLG